MSIVLITGAAGFIGSNLAAGLLARGDRVIGVDNFNDFYDPAIKRRNAAWLAGHKDFELAEADIRDGPAMGALVERVKPDAIAHLAAWAGVRPSIQRPAVYASNNVEGTIAMLEAARSREGLRFVLASSSSVYGPRNQPPFREDMNVDAPVSPYAATKRACEVLARTWHELHGMDIWTLRFFTCYGRAQRPDLAIHKFTRLIDRGEPVPMFGDGSAERDHLYIDDCVRGVIAAIDRCKGFEAINIGEARAVRLDYLIDLIAKTLGKPAAIQRLPEQPGDLKRTCADVTKARRLLGYEPSTPVEEGVRRFVEWYREEARSAERATRS